ncbi:hypothetical protein AURDEDRAFT_159908 [Auricularia subglabra TFB-10046 SS5]|nr:hypothetical protein AURDEDRAFT_159908 [Auricularia subglabra TFB-10046 SS5]
MGVYPDEDVVACVVDLLRYDEKLGRPNHHVLATLCLVNRVFLAVARRYLYQWVRLTTDDDATAFLEGCARRPLLGRSAHILQVDLQGTNTNKIVEPGVLPKRLAPVLSCCPNTRMLIMRALNPLPAALRSDIAATQAARSLKILRLYSATNEGVSKLLASLPLVDRLYARFERFVPKHSLPTGRRFVEVNASARWVAPGAKASHFVEPPWVRGSRLEIFSLVTCEMISPARHMHTLSVTLRSLSLDAWDNWAAAVACVCPRLVEIKLWHPFCLEDPLFLDRLPVTLEHFAYPSLGECYTRWEPDARQYQHEGELAAFPTRMHRLKTISTYDVNTMMNGNDYLSFPTPSVWADALPRIAEGAGIAHRHFESMRAFINVRCTRLPLVQQLTAHLPPTV